MPQYLFPYFASEISTKIYDDIVNFGLIGGVDVKGPSGNKQFERRTLPKLLAKSGFVALPPNIVPALE